MNSLSIGDAANSGFSNIQLEERVSDGLGRSLHLTEVSVCLLEEVRESVLSLL